VAGTKDLRGQLRHRHAMQLSIRLRGPQTGYRSLPIIVRKLDTAQAAGSPCEQTLTKARGAKVILDDRGFREHAALQPTVNVAAIIRLPSVACKSLRSARWLRYSRALLVPFRMRNS